jgi:fumarate reductase flavoprotein subunit
MKEYTADIAVMAAGPAGLCAAVQAAEDGAKVVVCEKAAVAGGAANMGMGPLAIGTKYQKNQLNDITVEEAFSMFMEYTHYNADANLVRRYFGQSAETIQWLEDKGVEFEGAYPYFPKSKSTWHIVKTGEAIGPRAASMMVKKLVEAAKDLGVELLLETPATDIEMKDGKVTALLAKDKDGNDVRINCKALIVATGGAGNNPKVIHDEIGFDFGQDMFNFAIPGINGDGIRLLRKCGAKPTQMRIEMTDSMPEILDADPRVANMFNQPNLLVNLLGKRFMNEDHMQNVTFTGNAICKQKKRMAFAIIDSSIIRYYMRHGLDVISLVHPSTDMTGIEESLAHALSLKTNDLYQGDTIEELGKACGIEDIDRLVQTVDEYNEMCDSVDSWFFKDKRWMKPIKKGPFYAGRLRPSGYGTLGGVLVNENCQALDKDYHAVPGLYVAGTDACNIYDDSYCFLLPGNTMGFAVNTGRIAGMEAAEYVQN